MMMNNVQLDEICEYLKELYPHKEDCYTKLFNKAKNHYKFYDINSLKDKDKLKSILNTFNMNDLFISSNTFKTKERASDGNLFAINSIAVDIDYKKKKQYRELTPKNIIKLLELDYFGQAIPEPTYIEYGNQLRLIYILEDTVYVPKGKPASKVLCNRISECFASKLSEFGAEIQKSEKFFRIPYSINNKSKSIIQIIRYSDYKYTLSELKENWIDELPTWYSKWAGQKAKIKRKKFNIYDFNKKRIEDFETIQDYLNNSGLMDYRKRLCFLYHNYTLLILKSDKKCTSPITEALNKTIEFNKKFKTPLMQNKLIGDTKFLRNKQYLYSNSKLMEFLDLDALMCIELDLKSIYTVESKEVYQKKYYINNKSDILKYKQLKYSENKAKNKYDKEKAKAKYQEKLKTAGKLSRKEENELLRIKIKDLLLQGLKQDYIALKLNIGVSTLKRHISVMKKEGLLE